MQKRTAAPTTNVPFFRSTITDEDGSPYLTRIGVNTPWGSLRLHTFHRGDNDPDPHDHPWDFWTFPLSRCGYYEEELRTVPANKAFGEYYKNVYYKPGERYLRARRVPGWRWSHRPATHTHRVLYPALCDFGFFTGDTEYNLNEASKAAGAKQAFWPIRTLVWTTKVSRPWGFLKLRDGRWCWQDWKTYVLEGGKHGPCE